MIGNITQYNATKRLLLLNRYYKITQFYGFLKDTALKAIMAIVAVGIVLVGLEYFVLDFSVIFNNLVELYSPVVVYSVFLVSETFLGLVPPEIFIAWASQSSHPWLFLFALASLSYIGGVIAYFIGNRLFLIPAIKNYIENKVQKHIVNIKKWGGVFVFLGAVSPLPHSMVSMAAGLINYKFKNYLLWSLFRYARFVLYALLIFQVL